MKRSFRQSTALVHTWAGVIVGWVLFFIFLTGTLGYVNHEIDRWMSPERGMASTSAVPSTLLPKAQDWLTREVADSQSWYIFFPTGLRSGEFTVGWRAWPDGKRRYGAYRQQELDPMTGKALAHTVRETGGGQTLYGMHYRLHYMPYDMAVLFVGICSTFMLVAIISGIVVHRRIFKNFFTFRPAKGQRSWLDGHNLLSVTALPFHLMITWSGLIFYMFTYIPTAADALYPEGEARDRLRAEVSGEVGISPARRARIAETASLEAILTRAEQELGDAEVGVIRIESPGRANSQVLIVAPQSGVSRTDRSLLFDGVSGELLGSGPNEGTATGRFEAMLLGLHEGLFAGPILRVLYVLAGLSGTAMIGSGLLLWARKRKAKLQETGRPHFGIVAVDILNLGTIIGLPIGIAAYFWANRLLPVGMTSRAEWEVHAMFLVWGLSYLYAIWRPRARAWFELGALTAMAYGFIPVLNALTTDRGLMNSIPAGDWDFAGFDLSAFAAGLFFAWLAWAIRRKQAQPGLRQTRRAEIRPMQAGG